MTHTSHKILFLGLGFELSLVLKYLLKLDSTLPTHAAFTRRNEAAAATQSKQYQLPFYLDNQQAIREFQPDLIIVGVKPIDLPSVLADLIAIPQSWQHLISIVASTPHNKLCQLFPGKQITTILPDDIIDADNPHGIVNFCSNDSKDQLIRSIFEPACQRLLKVEPSQMVAFNAAACQGNPLIALFASQYQDDWADFPSQLSHFFAALVTKINATPTASSTLDLTHQLAHGYQHYASNFSLGSEIFLATISSLFTKMQHRPDYQHFTSPKVLSQHFQNCATPGGLDERGHRTVKDFLRSGEQDFSLLPSLLMTAIIDQGKLLERQMVKAIMSSL